MASINPSDFNRRATLTPYTSGKRDSGGPYPIAGSPVTVWCKIEDLSGSTVPTQGQVRTDADYRVTLRYNASFDTNYILTYETLDMKIKNIQVDNEAYKRFMILLCSVTK